MNEKDQTTSAPQKTKAPSRKRSWVWLVIGLILLSAIPLAGGAFRLNQLASGAEITPDNARFFASPLPVVLLGRAGAPGPVWTDRRAFRDLDDPVLSRYE